MSDDRPPQDPDARVKKGFRIGVEAAARWCDRAAAIEDPTYRSAYECAARHIRALSAPPSQTTTAPTRIATENEPCRCGKPPGWWHTVSPACVEAA